MTNIRQKHALLCSAVAAGLYGCAAAGHNPEAAEFKVVPRATASEPAGPSDGLYLSAVAAIRRRDYALALEILQAARDRSPNDARVLNAFGVVYDKLGRFDLSSRYYAQAQAADPGSQIVAENLAYSKVLQGDARPAALAALQTPNAVEPAPQRSETITLAAITPAQSPGPAAAAPSQGSPVQVAPYASTAVAEPRGNTSPAAVAMRVPAAVQPVLVAVASAPPAATNQIARVLPAVRSIMATPLPRMQFAATPVSAPAKVAPAVMPEPHAVSTSAAAHVSTGAAVVHTPLMTRASLHTPGHTPISLSTGSGGPTRVAIQREHNQPLSRSATARPRSGVVLATDVRHPLALRTVSAVAARPPANRQHTPLVAAPQRTNVAARPATMGKPVKLVFSASQRRAASQLQFQLGRRGWTLASVSTRSAVTARSVIRYEPAQERIAFALARSLRIPVRLERCLHRCSGVTLVLGERPRTVAGQSVGAKKAQLG